MLTGNKIQLNMKFLTTNADIVDWKYVSKNVLMINSGIIRRFKYDLDWNVISSIEFLKESLMTEFKDFINWKIISRKQSLREGYITIFKDLIDWETLWYTNSLSETFIRANLNRVDGCWFADFRTYQSHLLKNLSLLFIGMKYVLIKNFPKILYKNMKTK